jgi:hypothetical protein
MKICGRSIPGCGNLLSFDGLMLWQHQRHIYQQWKFQYKLNQQQLGVLLEAS